MFSRRAGLGSYHLCGDNHGIRAPNPEQYLTPLQQKEVAIRHLRTKLLESENRVHDRWEQILDEWVKEIPNINCAICDFLGWFRETEIQDLKGQLSRMREDWIEEECHRVEAQLSLKEARKEIKQLRQVVETMKSSLMEKDKGIQKYFIDINIQNRKLESLLRSMELAQSGTNLQGENTLDFLCEGPSGGGNKLVGEEEHGMEMGGQGVEAMADSGLLINDEIASRVDIMEQVFMSTAVDFGQDRGMRSEPGVSVLSEDPLIGEPIGPTPNTISGSISVSTLSQQSTEDKGIQTDAMPCSPDLPALVLQLLQYHMATAGDTAPPVSTNLLGMCTQVSHTLAGQAPAPPPPSIPRPVPPESPDASTDSGTCCSEPAEHRGFMKELDFDVGEEEPGLSRGLDAVGKRYWSNSFLVDLVAVAAPLLPSVAWLCSRHGVDGSPPVYIAGLIRGCCIMGLHSLRNVTQGREE